MMGIAEIEIFETQKLAENTSGIGNIGYRVNPQKRSYIKLLWKVSILNKNTFLLYQ